MARRRPDVPLVCDSRKGALAEVNSRQGSVARSTGRLSKISSAKNYMYIYVADDASHVLDGRAQFAGGTSISRVTEMSGSHRVVQLSFISFIFRLFTLASFFVVSFFFLYPSVHLIRNM